MKIAIVDDEAKAREELQQALRSCELAAVAQAELRLFSSGEEFLADFQPDAIDLIFLDIRMGNLDGIETAQAIRRQAERLPIVFLTSSADYALAGYQVFPAGYLLKPISRELPQLLDILRRCLPGIVARELAVQVNGREIKIPYGSIAYVDVKGSHRTGGRRGSVIHLLAGETLPVDTSYTDVVTMLSTADFAECYNHLLVNLAAVAALQEDGFALKNGEQLPISRRLYRETAHSYMDYLLRK
ncbi:two component transcriptional regulator, LytTR family [Selenomonas sp. GACV-9]|uniref:LytR/AlgR family response regulator transcription factor n=1 Tax=Selenomonas sp. GACV-9 TaxID=3158782 RepID=UPI0008EEAB1A|nr:two component transcriptional regulator, LytTR family [Selenomonas ruminantium]